MNKAKIVTLCGSTKFKDDFDRIRKELALKGYIVLSPDFYSKSDESDNKLLFHGKSNEETEMVRLKLKANHISKILISDGIYVINKDGYIGESTKIEIDFARINGKFIEYMEKERK